MFAKPEIPPKMIMIIFGELLTPLHVWWQNGMKGRFPLLTSLGQTEFKLVIQWEKLILITGCYEKLILRFSWSRQIWGPEELGLLLGEVRSNLTKCSSPNRLLLSNQDRGSTPNLAHSLALTHGPGLLNVSITTCLLPTSMYSGRETKVNLPIENLNFMQ